MRFNPSGPDPRRSALARPVREIARARELLADAALGGHEYGTTLKDRDRFFALAAAARAGR
jgi:hypothetical protein